MSDMPSFHPTLRSVRRRIIATIGILAGGLATFVLYLAFVASRFAWYQNLAVGLTILIVAPAIVVGLWVSWGLRTVDRWVHPAPWDDW